MTKVEAYNGEVNLLISSGVSAYKDLLELFDKFYGNRNKFKGIVDLEKVLKELNYGEVRRFTDGADNITLSKCCSREAADKAKRVISIIAKKTGLNYSRKSVDEYDLFPGFSVMLIDKLGRLHMTVRSRDELTVYTIREENSTEEFIKRVVKCINSSKKEHKVKSGQVIVSNREIMKWLEVAECGKTITAYLDKTNHVKVVKKPMGIYVIAEEIKLRKQSNCRVISGLDGCLVVSNVKLNKGATKKILNLYSECYKRGISIG